MPDVLLLLVSVILCIQGMVGYKSNFERFEQFFGQEYIDLDLRVRKYNRTTTVLNGTVYIQKPMDDTIVFSSDVFHSRLGNQQFQHYPMHLPTCGYCKFVNNLHQDYGQVIQAVVNMSAPGECPVSERSMFVVDELFPNSVLPDSLSPGLWKMVITGMMEEEVVIRLMISIRLYDDLFF